MRSEGMGAAVNSGACSSACHSGGTAASTVTSRSRRVRATALGSGDASTTSAPPVATAHNSWLKPYTELKGRSDAARSSARSPR